MRFFHYNFRFWEQRKFMGQNWKILLMLQHLCLIMAKNGYTENAVLEGAFSE
jgi:hypothetical protein